MTTLPNFQVTPHSGTVENVEFNFRSLYLHHIFSGPTPTQAVIIQPDATTGWGQTAVNNWQIFDGICSDPDATAVARVHGMHIFAGNWQNSFSIVFEQDESLKDSTLQVMGLSITHESQWAIVGGTGVFEMARGIITRKLHETRDDRRVSELTIRGFCNMQSIPSFKKAGPWGGEVGSVRDIVGKSWRLESVTIRAGGLIDSFAFSFIDMAGQRRTVGPWGAGGIGTPGVETKKFQLGPSEAVQELTGTIGKHDGVTLITSLAFVTNTRSLIGPFGTTTYGGTQNTPFKAEVPQNSIIVGFFGRADRFLNSIGVYTI